MTRLEREGSLEIRSEVPPDDPGWEGADLRFLTPLSLSGRAQCLSNGDVLVRLAAVGVRSQECRRCLEPVQVEVDEIMDLLFVPGTREGEEDGVRPLPELGGELDLREAVREEMILTQSPFALCAPDCKGLCPGCGVNLNEESCQCSGGEPDPRWEALRGLKEEQE